MIFAACDKNGDDPDNPGAVEIENTVVTINTDGTTSSGVPFEWIPGSYDSEFSLNYITYKVDYANTQVIVSGANKDGLQNRLDGKASIPKSIILDKITYPITLVEKKAFYQCKELKSINIPETVTKIEESAFHGCTNLTNIQLYNGLSEISKNAFNSCEKLEFIQIPNSITKLGEYAFADCHSLELFSDKLPSSIGYTLEKGVFMNCSSIKKITIPEEMHVLNNSAFKGCSSLEEFTADDLYELKDSVFDGCSNLKNFSTRVVSMVTAIFRNCRSLESITVFTLNTIGTAWFQGCSSLKYINLTGEKPNHVENVRDYGLDGCSSLETLSIDRTIGMAALRNCTSLKDLGCVILSPFSQQPPFENVITENLYISKYFFTQYKKGYYNNDKGWNLKAKNVYVYSSSSAGDYSWSDDQIDECKEIFQAEIVLKGTEDKYKQAFGYSY